MNLRHLIFFSELAKTEHMAKAAEILGISQPSLSYAISKLEEELGVPLFEKDGRNIKLTNYGKAYLQYVKKSLNELSKGSEYISELLDISQGHIKLGFTYTMGQDLIPRLITKFRQSDNKTSNISFSLSQSTTNSLVKALLEDKLDVVIASKPDNQIISDQLNTYHLVNQEIQAIVPISNPLAEKNEINIKDLVKFPLIYYSHKSGLRPCLDKIFKQANVTPKVKIEAEEDSTIIGFVNWGVGVALIPNMPLLALKNIKALKLTENIGVHSIYLITKANHFLTPSVNYFTLFIKNYCQKYFVKNNFLI